MQLRLPKRRCHAGLVRTSNTASSTNVKSTVKGSVHPNHKQQNKTLNPHWQLNMQRVAAETFTSAVQEDSVLFTLLKAFNYSYSIKKRENDVLVHHQIIHRPRCWRRQLKMVSSDDCWHQGLWIIMDNKITGTLHLERHILKGNIWMFWGAEIKDHWWDAAVADSSKTQQTSQLHHGWIPLGGKCFEFLWFVWTDPFKEKW